MALMSPTARPTRPCRGGVEPAAVTLDAAIQLIDERAAKGPAKKKGGRAGSRQEEESQSVRSRSSSSACRMGKGCRCRPMPARRGGDGRGRGRGPGARAWPRHAVATGFAIAIPPGFEVQVRPRSGLALKHGITCLNTPGTIDEDYRGEVKVILANLGSEPFAVKRGERIAQLVPAPVQKAAFAEVAMLGATPTGGRGLRLTGR